jgi:2',3'-cyclic-nucleotide 2'-phosphodiesterase (5'-nucleotidase family)
MRTARVSLIVSLLVVLLSAAGGVRAGAPQSVDVQILAINDFHGNVLPLSGSGMPHAPGLTSRSKLAISRSSSCLPFTLGRATRLPSDRARRIMWCVSTSL